MSLSNVSVKLMGLKTVTTLVVETEFRPRTLIIVILPDSRQRRSFVRFSSKDTFR